MAAEKDTLRRLEKQGMKGITDELGMSTVSSVMRHMRLTAVTQVAVMPVLWSKFMSRMGTGGMIPPFLSHVVVAGTGTAGVEGARAVASELLQGMPEEARLEYVLQLVLDTAKEVSGITELEVDAPLMEAGLDSLALVELRNTLSSRLGGMQLSATVFLDYPTVRGMASHLLEELLPSSQGSRALQRAPIVQSGASEGMAVVGLACRLPGGSNSPAAFWKMLLEGGDGIVEVPAERFDIDEVYDPNPDTENKCYVRHGGFIEDVELFDARFFGISPAEVRSMDPQQRLLLEVGYEALARSGSTKASLLDSSTGVFVGISPSEWSRIMDGSAGAYSGTGASISIAANRVSYVLGLKGPSHIVDTACSSSLVALDAACMNLRLGRCEQALVAGVNLLLGSATFIAFCKARMLSVDGRCKTFDASANGYVRGEGCCAVVLKGLSDAKAQGDRVLAIIKGTAVNQDGRSATLTAPNGPSQEQVIALALEEAGVSPTDVEYVETHGTGTALGDPIEVGALKAIYGSGRESSRPLVLGALKTNIGHLEPASGLAGLIKTVLVLAHRRAPRNLHLKTLNPHMDLEGFPVVFPREEGGMALGSWTGHGGRVVAGVSSFGFGGTNAHVVLEESESDAYLNAQIGKRVAFLFTGQGSQYPGMGRELYETEAVFQDVIDRCGDILLRIWGRPLLPILYPGPSDDASLIGETVYAQPALFAIEYAMATLWRSRGIIPAALLGHSVGEYTAACFGGALSLENGLYLISERARLMYSLPKGDGCMMAVRASEDRVAKALEEMQRLDSGVAGTELVSIAAVNGPKSVVLSGPEPALKRLMSKLEVEGRTLAVSHAFHSPSMAPVAEQLKQAVARMAFKPLSMALVTNVTGQLVLEDQLGSGDHWAQHLVGVVRFADGMRTLRETLRCEVFVEVGPDATLLNMGRQCLRNARDLAWIPSLNGQKGASRVFEQAVETVQGLIWGV
jgi:acyl transferase domain-containing protein